MVVLLIIKTQMTYEIEHKNISLKEKYFLDKAFRVWFVVRQDGNF